MNITKESNSEDSKFELKQLICSPKNTILCDACGENESKIFCKICEEYQCNECEKQLHFPKRKRNHHTSFIPPQEYQKQKMNEMKTCLIHHENLKLICFTCNKLICFGCVINGFGSHFDHDTEPIVEIHEEYKKLEKLNQTKTSHEIVTFEHLNNKIKEIMETNDLKSSNFDHKDEFFSKLE